MVKTLGGSLFVRNAIKYDYCIEEAIASLEACCDDVFILDCQSDDGTTEKLGDFISGRGKHVRYQTNGDWNCGKDYHKLSKLANMCISHLKTDWHFMLQADEVLHEKSFGPIRRLIAKPGTSKTFSVRRYNLFGTPDHHIRLDLKQKPCSDNPVRLGLRRMIAKGDGESLEWTATNRNHVDEMVIFHYGYVRKGFVNVVKAVDMQTWFFGEDKPPRVDGRLLEMKKTGKWEPWKIMPKSAVAKNPMDHPVFSKAWAEERK